MTRTTREIEKDRNENLFIIILFVMITLFFTSIIVSGLYTREQLKDVPHKVCHNEIKLIYNSSNLNGINIKGLHELNMGQNVILVNGADYIVINKTEVCEWK